MPEISNGSIVTLTYCFCNAFTIRSFFLNFYRFTVNIMLSYHVYINTTYVYSLYIALMTVRCSDKTLVNKI